MRQQSLTDGFEKFRKKQFLEDMNSIIPWKELVEVIEPFYPKPEGAERRPVGIERMLRIYFLQHWFSLSDPAAEEALYDSRAMRRFVGVDLGSEPVPDETTICKFRHLMERDPEMHQTRKGNQWYFGMKAHIGVDSRSKLIHSVAATAANVHDSVVLEDLLHGNEARVYGDSAYSGKKSVIGSCAKRASDFTQRKGSRYRKLTDGDRATNRYKSKVRARVEHPFWIMRGLFGFRKVRYRGLAKNAHHLFVSCALINMAMARKTLLKRRRIPQAQCA